MHFRGIDGSGKSWTSVEFLVYMAPENLNAQDQETMDSQNLMKASLYIGSAQYSMTLQFFN